MKNQNIHEIELKYNPSFKLKRIRGNGSNDVCQILRNTWNEDTLNLCEEFKVLYLNRGNWVIGVYHHSKGGIAGTVADPRLIIGIALKSAASGIILAHNHPSGNLNPSREDKELTEKIRKGCLFFDLHLLDHIILTQDGYFSFKENGIL